MSIWQAAAAVLILAMACPLLLIARRPVMDGVVALQLIGVLAVLVLLLLAEADADPALADPAVVLAALCIGAALVFVRHLERPT